MRLYSLIILLVTGFTILNGQVRVRLFAALAPESVIFTVNNGNYLIESPGIDGITLTSGEMLFLSSYKRMVAVNLRNSEGFVCDTLKIRGVTGNDSFSLRTAGPGSLTRTYSGDLHCFYDLENVLFINVCDTEEYLAGVVRTEGGEGRHIEYAKSQALLARTYMYRNLDKHLADNFNLCDDIHCQAYHGMNTDPVITMAVQETRGQVLTDKNNVLIISAFHSNCGGETAQPEDVWLSGQPYLKKVNDPHCTASKNATWRKSILLQEWITYLQENGYGGSTDPPGIFRFAQVARLYEYRAGSFRIPLNRIRNDHNLRSAFFSVEIEGDSVVLIGRGYGHGVGLCQEGAMTMALKGFNYRQIIDFYFSGLIISDIKNALKPEKVL